jgi:hypothetical protein
MMETKEKGRKMLTIAKIQNCVQKIFGDESHNVRIVHAGNMFKIEIRNRIHDGVWIRSENTMEEKINDIFYDYCMENVDWMGIS